MNFTNQKIKYRDMKDLSVQLEFIVACNKVQGNELINVSLENTEAASRFRSSAIKLLRAMKRDGVIKLFVFENDLGNFEKMETVYMINKFPFLSEIKKLSETTVYIKL